MAIRYTILKVLIQNLSKSNNFKKGFTLIELIVGLSIMLIVGGLAMNAFIQASTTFNKDKRTIDSSQNMSVILEMIGNDIRQSGENISEGSFPTIEFKTNTDAGSKSGSSKITIRRALIGSLTLCEKINASQNLATLTTPNVADNATATVNSSASCNVATSSSPLSVYRVAPAVTTPATPTTYYPPTVAITNPYPATPLTPTLPLALRKLRDYRCELDNLNPTTAYDSAANASTDFCGSPNATLEKLRIAVSNLSGQFLIFNQTGEVADTGNTADTVSPPIKKYQITVNTNFARPDPTADPTIDPAIASNLKNNAVEYNIGSPIYVIEERIYTLTTDGYLQVSINGKAPTTLIKKIDNFRVSARTYTNTTDRLVQPTPTANVCTDAAPFAAQPTTPDENSPKYICQFNYFTGTAATDKADWKTLAGIKVEVQAKYDGTGQSATASTQDMNKLYAAAEFFPRNVLSK
jgi:prepilin-type N-terminal cleavage/methylation domain-containing protein